MTAYQAYLTALRREPEAIIFVATGGRYRTFEQDAILVASRFNLKLIRVDRRQTVTVGWDQVAELVTNDVKVGIVEEVTE